MQRLRVAALISGRGSNLQALLDASAAGAPFEIVHVLANTPGAPGLERATAAGVGSDVVDHRPFKGDRTAFEDALLEALQPARPDWIALAGFMRVLTPKFLEAFSGRVVNIHPALLPLFPGLRTHERALEAGVALHGCTVHAVTAGVDEGPIIGQAAVPVHAGDTPDSLARRVLAAEHVLYPACLSLIADPAATAPPPSAPGMLISIRSPARR